MLKKNRVTNVSQVDRDTRSNFLKVHISLTFIFKILAIGLSYFLVPLIINYLDVERYGIWITLLSIMSWMTFYDLGLGNGMRNKLAESLARNNIKLANTYISSAYLAISFIAFIFFIVLISILKFINWNNIFNTTSISNIELSKIVFVVSLFFLFNFVLSLCKQIFYAYQKASLAPMAQFLMNLFALTTIYILIHYTSGRLLYLSVCYGLSMVLSNLFLTCYFFKKHKEITLSIRNVDLKKIKEIISLGVKFFIIQMAVLVVFATDNIIITQVLGPAHVTPYNILFKLFSIVIMGINIITAPLWSAYTEAYAKGDIKWISNTLKKLNLLMIPIIISVLLLVIFARDIINIWIGPHIEFTNLLVVFMGIYTVITVWGNIYSSFLNGVSHLKLSLTISIFAALVNIPLSIYFAKTLQLGSAGIILGTVICLSPGSFLAPFQTWYIIHVKNKRGVLEAIFS